MPAQSAAIVLFLATLSSRSTGSGKCVAAALKKILRTRPLNYMLSHYMQMCLWRGETLPKCVCNQVRSAKCGEMEWRHGVTPLKQGEIRTSQKSLLLSYTAAGWVRNQQLYKTFNVKTYLIYYKNVWKYTSLYTSLLRPPTHLALRLVFFLSEHNWMVLHHMKVHLGSKLSNHFRRDILGPHRAQA